jgi:poly-gamma-glutamate system protein
MKFLNLINIRSNYVLLFLALLSLGGFFIVENNKIMRKDKWYDEKIEAAILCKKAAQTIKHYRYGHAKFVNSFNDPNETGLIGYEYSPITSEKGSFSAKSTVTNPNFAALNVHFLRELDVEEGDYIAVGMTGSYPALNIAVCAALQTLKLKPIIISSVSSSSWGANDPEFTWLDMTKVLCDSGIISFNSVAASIGASGDIGRGLSLEGVELSKESIKRNNLQLICFDSIKNNVALRMHIYDSCTAGKPIKAYINVGGGVASMGSVKNEGHIPQGLNRKISLHNFPEKIGVVYEMAKRGIPVIHLLDVHALAATYDLPIKPIPLPEPGSGELFESKKYNLFVLAPITFVLLALIIFIIYHDKRNVRLGKDILRTEQKNENDLIL